MEFEKFEVITMTKQSKWEDDNTPLEDFNYTEDFEEWYSAYESIDKQFYLPLSKYVCEFIHNKRKNKAYIMGPTGIYNQQTLLTKTRKAENIEEMMQFLENNDIILFGIWTTIGGIQFKHDEKSFIPLGELCLNPQRIIIRYAQL